MERSGGGSGALDASFPAGIRVRGAAAPPESQVTSRLSCDRRPVREDERCVRGTSGETRVEEQRKAVETATAPAAEECGGRRSPEIPEIFRCVRWAPIFVHKGCHKGSACLVTCGEAS